MNDLTRFTPSHRFKEFFTAREMAEIAAKRGVSTFPHSVQGVRKLADAQGWNDLPRNLCRPRGGKGGGREYHFALMPQIMLDALAGWATQAMLAERHADQCDADQRKMAALRTWSLSAHARAVMQARAEILSSIEGYAIAHQQYRKWGIAAFLKAQEQHHERDLAEARRDAGQPLTERDKDLLARRSMLTSDDGFQIDPVKITVANDRRKSASISRSTIYGWFKTRDENGVTALAPTPTKAKEPIPDAFFEFMKFYAIPRKPSIAAAHRKYVEEAAKQSGVQLMTLSLDQVTRILSDKLNNIEKNVGREGILTLRSRMAYVTRTTEDMWPTTIYTADGKTFDAEIADPVTRLPIRPEITSVLDVATRKCVGYALSRKENVIAVTEALRRSVTNNGICAIFYVDRGVGYKNKTFDADVGGLMGRLGITKMHALPYNSQGKGIIERFNHVWNDLAREQLTYISKDMDKEAKSAIHKETRGEIRAFGTARRLPTWETFVEQVEKTIVDYNDRPHRGLPEFEDPSTGRIRHMTPNEAWDAHVASGFKAVTIDPAEADDLFRPYEIRTVQRAQVTINKNTYFDAALERYHKESVMVGYDYHQADKVWVREFDVKTGQPGKLICVAGFMANAQRYVPVTFEQQALETRAKTRLKRIEGKATAIEAELNAPYLIDQDVEISGELFDLQPEEPVVAQRQVAPDSVKNIADTQPRRQVFASDEELAAWALNHPDELLPNQITVLRRCMNNSTARELFRMSGIDTEALRNLLRAVA